MTAGEMKWYGVTCHKEDRELGTFVLRSANIIKAKNNFVEYLKSVPTGYSMPDKPKPDTMAKVLGIPLEGVVLEFSHLEPCQQRLRDKMPEPDQIKFMGYDSPQQVSQKQA